MQYRNCNRYVYGLYKYKKMGMNVIVGSGKPSLVEEKVG